MQTTGRQFRRSATAMSHWLRTPRPARLRDAGAGLAPNCQSLCIGISRILLVLCIDVTAIAVTRAACASDRTAPERYTFRDDHDPNGTGKFYLGREIALVMGHQGATWLERPEREQEEAPDALLSSLALRPGLRVADMGAGSGYMSFRLARRVGTNGKVYAVDLQPEMLTLIRERAKADGVSNVDIIQGALTDAKLPPGAIDMILLVDVYHEFSHPWEMTESMIGALRPGGRLVFVEYRLEDPTVPIKLVHKMSEKQVLREMGIHRLRWTATLDHLPRQHVIIFEKLEHQGSALR